METVHGVTRLKIRGDVKKARWRKTENITGRSRRDSEEDGHNISSRKGYRQKEDGSKEREEEEGVTVAERQRVKTRNMGNGKGNAGRKTNKHREIDGHNQQVDGNKKHGEEKEEQRGSKADTLNFPEPPNVRPDPTLRKHNAAPLYPS
ncbi:hypothetical protein Pcinc_034479 [Petrolisthes cinctipes]|uniref:Uncharacterized protein n=1 Tax=Petrolisthes cinctipes TaxID=88211 RepID=A0AAE1JZ37_PETCI|nr:hypothetical protein Pcinc_034479 [Petrolisthes cinctipes]